MIARLSLQDWDSKAALLAHLEAYEPRTLVVGLAAEGPSSFSSFSVISSRGVNEIGLIASGFGLEPIAVLLADGRRVLIGHDFWLTWIDVEELAVVGARELPSVVYDFVSVEQEDEILVVHELGALRVDANGEVRWSVDSSDIIESFRSDADGNLILDVWDAPALVISMASGAITRKL